MRHAWSRYGESSDHWTQTKNAQNTHESSVTLLLFMGSLADLSSRENTSIRECSSPLSADKIVSFIDSLSWRKILETKSDLRHAVSVFWPEKEVLAREKNLQIRGLLFACSSKRKIRNEYNKKHSIKIPYGIISSTKKRKTGFPWWHKSYLDENEWKYFRVLDRAKDSLVSLLNIQNFMDTLWEKAFQNVFEKDFFPPRMFLPTRGAWLSFFFPLFFHMRQKGFGGSDFRCKKIDFEIVGLALCKLAFELTVIDQNVSFFS